MLHEASCLSPLPEIRANCGCVRDVMRTLHLPLQIGHYARMSLQLEACDNVLYEANGVYEVTVGRKAFGS